MDMMRRNLILLSTLALGGCINANGPSAFQTYSELFGASASSNDDGGSGGGGGNGSNGQATFRQTSDITVANGSPNFELNIRVAAWVYPSSITTAEQQDALINGGYVQLTRETALGSAFLLPPGTFVFSGGGLAGATTLRIEPGAGNFETLTMITPDVVLFFMEPPNSCETVGFTFTNEGFPLDAQGVTRDGVTAPFAGYTGATDDLGTKHLALINGYQCNPFKPGVYLKTTGGGRQPNEFFEGESIRIDCFTALQDGNAAILTIGE